MILEGNAFPLLHDHKHHIQKGRVLTASKTYQRRPSPKRKHLRNNKQMNPSAASARPARLQAQSLDQPRRTCRASGAAMMSRSALTRVGRCSAAATARRCFATGRGGGRGGQGRLPWPGDLAVEDGGEGHRAPGRGLRAHGSGHWLLEDCVGIRLGRCFACMYECLSVYVKGAVPHLAGPAAPKSSEGALVNL